MIIGYKNQIPNLCNTIKISASEFNNFKDVPIKYILDQPQKSFALRNFENKDFIEKINLNSTPLFEILDIRQAIKTGDDKKYIVQKKIESNYKPVIGGKHIGKYKLNNSQQYVNYGSFLACPRDYKIFEQPKILIRETGRTITATFDDSNYYVLSSLYNAILKDDKFSLKFILSLINSKLYQYLMNLLTLEKTSGAFTKARIFHYYKLPVKNILIQDQLPFVNLVDEIIESKKQGMDTKELEDKIDRMVYELYGLTEEEIGIVEGKK